MNAKDIIASMLEVAKAAAPIVGHGLPEAIQLGERIVDMIDRADAVFKGENVEDLIAERDALEARVNAHVDKTAQKLRGE